VQEEGGKARNVAVVLLIEEPEKPAPRLQSLLAILKTEEVTHPPIRLVVENAFNT
jgi:hypothetical protein